MIDQCLRIRAVRLANTVSSKSFAYGGSDVLECEGNADSEP